MVNTLHSLSRLLLRVISVTYASVRPARDSDIVLLGTATASNQTSAPLMLRGFIAILRKQLHV